MKATWRIKNATTFHMKLSKK
jgi:hypothetical protein